MSIRQLKTSHIFIPKQHFFQWAKRSGHDWYLWSTSEELIVISFSIMCNLWKCSRCLVLLFSPLSFESLNIQATTNALFSYRNENEPTKNIARYFTQNLWRLGQDLIKTSQFLTKICLGLVHSFTRTAQYLSNLGWVLTQDFPAPKTWFNEPSIKSDKIRALIQYWSKTCNFTEWVLIKSSDSIRLTCKLLS